MFEIIRWTENRLRLGVLAVCVVTIEHVISVAHAALAQSSAEPSGFSPAGIEENSFFIEQTYNLKSASFNTSPTAITSSIPSSTSSHFGVGAVLRFLQSFVMSRMG